MRILLSAVFVLFGIIFPAHCDTPANCSYEDVRGIWIFKEGPRGNEKTVNHELAHSFFWSDDDYKNDMTKLVDSIPNKDKFLSILANERGYGKNVLIDEAQAFMSTGLIVNISDWEQHKEPFIKRFNQQRESVLNESFGRGGETKSGEVFPHIISTSKLNFKLHS
jgi:hypothetical protein